MNVCCINWVTQDVLDRKQAPYLLVESDVGEDLGLGYRDYKVYERHIYPAS